jgi:hypothetical protein
MYINGIISNFSSICFQYDNILDSSYPVYEAVNSFKSV